MAKAVSLTADDLSPAKTRQQTTTRQRGVVPTAELVPMQFRMPPDFAIAFRTEAAKRSMKYNELLQECFAAFMKKTDRDMANTPKSLTRVQNRLIEAAALIEEQDNQTLCFQHSVFCQVGLPYRDPGADVVEWQRDQGSASLLVTAGKARNPTTGKWVQIGLPWGSKPRLILTHLNAEALRQKSPTIEIESSLSAFVKRIRGFTGGREILTFKEQVSRLANSKVSLAFDAGERSFQLNAQVVTAFDLWMHKDDRQRVLWPSTVRLSLDYFESLQAHAVPLREESVAALAHSAMALDLYAWLAQRLHRIKPEKPQFISWAALKGQFGPDYGRMNNFKAFFRKELKQVWTQYNAARLDLDDKGITLWNSEPPASRKYPLLSGGNLPSRRD